MTSNCLPTRLTNQLLSPISKNFTLQQCCLALCSLSNSSQASSAFNQQQRQSAPGQTKRRETLSERWARLPIPKENLEIRAAAQGDKQQVLDIEPGIHYGLDYLQDYYEDIVSSDHRCGIVAVDTVSKRILSFGYAVVNEGGRNLSYASGRTLKEMRSYALAAQASQALFELLKPRLHPAVVCCGVYNLPTSNRRYFDSLDSLLKVVLHNQQLGFECPADYWTNLAAKFAASEPSPNEPVLVSNPVDFLISEAVCSSTENRLFKPDQHILIAKESLTFSRGNLLIWNNFLHQVMASYSEPGPVPTGEVTGVSIANWNSVPVGGLHLVLNIYCRTESDAVAHLAGQLRAVVQRLRLTDSLQHRLFISAFVPSHLLFNETLTGVRLHPVLRDLPHSVSPKLACDVRIAAWSPGTFV